MVPELLTDKKRKTLLSDEQWMQIRQRMKASPREFQVTVRVFDGWTMEQIVVYSMRREV